MKAVCSIYDSEAQLYGDVFTAPGAVPAKRSFIDWCAKTPYASSYQLHQLASFDDNSGEFQIHTPPILIVKGEFCAKE